MNTRSKEGARQYINDSLCTNALQNQMLALQNTVVYTKKQNYRPWKIYYHFINH